MRLSSHGVQVLLLTILLENVALPWGHIVVPAEFDLVTGAEKTFPSGDWIGPNHRAGASRQNISQVKRDSGQDFFDLQTYCSALKSSPVFSGEPR